MINSEVGDKCFVDTMTWEIIGDKVRMFAEVDGVSFDSFDYDDEKSWLADIVKRVQDCALGQLNFGKDGDAINKFNATQVIKIKRY